MSRLNRDPEAPLDQSISRPSSITKGSLFARPAAIKLIRSSVAGNGVGRSADMRRRFEREAQIIAQLRSPHTVTLFDFGVSEGGSFYYVMELLDGVDTDTLIRRFGALPAERVVHILRQMCHSLSEAESFGLVHRDIKPRLERTRRRHIGQLWVTFETIVETGRETECTMSDVQNDQEGIRQVQPSTRNAVGERPMRPSGAIGLGAVAVGALALGATAIGALAIGRLAVGAFVMRRGRVRSLTVDNLEVRRLHVRELTIDSGGPNARSSG